MLKSSVPIIHEARLSPSQVRFFQSTKVLFFIFAQILHYNTSIILYQDTKHNIQHYKNIFFEVFLTIKDILAIFAVL